MPFAILIRYFFCYFLHTFHFNVETRNTLYVIRYFLKK